MLPRVHYEQVSVSESHFKHFTSGDVGSVDSFILCKLYKICVSGHGKEPENRAVRRSAFSYTMAGNVIEIFEM